MDAGIRCHQFVKKDAEKILERGLFAGGRVLLVFKRLEYENNLVLLVR